ncbi:MAG TPA: HPF/RaiA family ribosome-associated protein [Verrucomicrobiae bacterium]
MKLTLQHLCVRSTDQLDGWVESRILSLQDRLQIDEANVRLECCFQTSPPFAVHVHLVTPGPDVFAEGRDHTLRAAFGKVMAELETKIAGREQKRTQRLRSRLSAPAGRSRNGNRAR